MAISQFWGNVEFRGDGGARAVAALQYVEQSSLINRIIWGVATETEMLNFKRETLADPNLLSQAFRWQELYSNSCCGGSKEVDRINIVLDHCAGNRGSTPLRPPLLPGDIGPGEELQASFFMSQSQTYEATQRNMPFLQKDFAAPLLRYLKERSVYVSYSHRQGRPPGLRLGINLHLAHAFFNRVCDRCGQLYQVLCELAEAGQYQVRGILDPLPVEGGLGRELRLDGGEGAQGGAAEGRGRGRRRGREAPGRGALGREGRGRGGGGARGRSRGR